MTGEAPTDADAIFRERLARRQDCACTERELLTKTSRTGESAQDDVVARVPLLVPEQDEISGLPTREGIAIGGQLGVRACQIIAAVGRPSRRCFLDLDRDETARSERPGRA